MDPLTAIGLASAIVQFIEFGIKIAERLDELANNASDVPRSLQAISTQLPLLLNSLGRIKSDAHLGTLDFDTRCILRGIVSGCMAQIAEVETMINEISRAPGDSFKVKMKKVFASLRYDEKAWDVERNLQTYISVLILHHVIDSKDAPAPLSEDTFFDVREKRVSPFVERPRLMRQIDEHLHAAARSQTTNPVILLLAGEGKTGKTQLVLEYCYQAHSLNQFRSVFWLDASSLESLYLGFESMYATIKRSADGSRKEKLAFVANFLNNLWHPWLLVLDNYEPALVYNHIMDILPSMGYGGIILITNSEAHDGLGKVIRVPKFLTTNEQTTLNSVLIQEVQRQNEEEIRRAVDLGADVNTLIWDQWPVLHRCALFGLSSSVSFLLEQGAIPNPPGAKVRKPLYWAASGGHAKTASLLLDHEDETGIYSNEAENQAVFNEAAEKGSLEIMRMMRTRREVILNSRNQYNATPLQNAAKHGHMEVLRFLITEGALLENHSQAEGAFIAASSAGHFEVVKVLCGEGKVSPNVLDEDGKTPLACAAASKDPDTRKANGLEVVRYLLSKGADPNPLTGSESPLEQAALHDHMEIVALLLEHGADPMNSLNGTSPLTSAIRFKSPGVIPLLLAAPVRSSTARKAWLERGMRYACRTGDRGVVLQLLEAGADIDAVEDDGLPKGASPLVLAILSGHVKVAQLLIRRGARQDVADERGRLALPLAAESGYEMVVRDLVRAGGEVDGKSGENGDTPLIVAAVGGHEKVVRVLLENGADKEGMNRFGDMALDVAEEKGYKEVVKLLQ
ncbi:Multiple ankyrin repeat single KH domain-containing [Hyphodiscus hymeniophilus]|uniref:Multiple ankyrin repeat single KH domain-containing n=1 Tax=Hyphodiscus hymeniophilus TaxID=353542 RepID=A0A9P6SL84_9HELO|nr:Multiple ankyrin repeat single KH domain-containing [Hyphodiscus hymeniophilus]